MESWRKVWREGVAPLLSLEGLTALLNGLRDDDKRIIQGATTTPPPLHCVEDWPVEAADCFGYAFWIGDRKGEACVKEVEEFFAKCCFECDQKLGEPAACRWFINWFDETPRDEMRMSLSSEVLAEIYHRAGCPYQALDVVLKAPTAPPGVLADMLDEAGQDVAARAMRAIHSTREKETV